MAAIVQRPSHLAQVEAGRLRQLKAELAALKHAQETLAALRLQRWCRLRWSRKALRRQLLRVRLLLLSCRMIQRAWRRRLHWRQRREGEVSLSWKLHPVPGGAAVVRVGGLAWSPDDGTDQWEDFSQEPIEEKPSCGRDDFSDHGSRPPRRDASDDGSGRGACRADPGGVVVDPKLAALELQCGRQCRRIIASWWGFKTRRALACKAVQAKLHLWYDTYQLIADVERGRAAGAGGPDVRVDPWVDALYNGLSKCQHEALEEFQAAMRRGATGGYRLRWRGWYVNLERARLPLTRAEAEGELSRRGSSSGLEGSLEDVRDNSLPSAARDHGIDSILKVAGRGGSGRGTALLAAAAVASSPSTPSFSSSHPVASRPRAATTSGTDWSHVKPRVSCWDTSTTQGSRSTLASSASGGDLPGRVASSSTASTGTGSPGATATNFQAVASRWKRRGKPLGSGRAQGMANAEEAAPAGYGRTRPGDLDATPGPSSQSHNLVAGAAAEEEVAEAAAAAALRAATTATAHSDLAAAVPVPTPAAAAAAAAASGSSQDSSSATAGSTASPAAWMPDRRSEDPSASAAEETSSATAAPTASRAELIPEPRSEGPTAAAAEASSSDTAASSASMAEAIPARRSEDPAASNCVES
eukprot:TRINITY_DN20995_c0_g1_i4.p1 TRINITY_DN20995_c0_g1~~TRINITY_DN20995_c0_g1_i4.p1  ORF type:complete len:642 (-),score=122.71 TRINITY_DN20995_c0_g1_i4:237-2162(-)